MNPPPVFEEKKYLASMGIEDKGFKKYLITTFVIAAITLIGFCLKQTLDSATIGMFFLLGVVGIAFWFGRGPALTASILGILSWDYFIIPPYFSFAITTSDTWITLFVMLVVSLVISTLASLSRQAEGHRVIAENEKNRSALLSAVSHDLRTPLTAIVGASSGLMNDKGQLSQEERAQLAQSIYEEADRMNRLVQNLLDMTRLQSGALRLKKEWQSVEEVIGASLDRLKHRLEAYPFALRIQPHLPLVLMDALLIEQLLLNLLENALNHTPPGTRVELSAREDGEDIEIKISDRGPGLVPGEEKFIFEKFTRGSQSGQRGVGLGLSICRGIALAHSGKIKAANRQGGGASFTVILPIGGTPPTVPEE